MWHILPSTEVQLLQACGCITSLCLPQSCLSQTVFLISGKPERLEYGVDSYGNLCGVKNDWDGTGGPDLTLKTKLYYLNPLELLNPETVDTAKAICVEECPASADICGVAQFPCTTAAQYRLVANAAAQRR